MDKTAKYYANHIANEYAIHNGKIDIDDLIYCFVDSERLDPQRSNELELAINNLLVLEGLR